MTRLRMLQFFRDALLQRAELERQVGGPLVLPPTTQPVTQPAAESQTPAAEQPQS